jgi:TetR/AcrR family transcriptional regulator, lmrAB and yxaGH operons repressor
MDKTMQDLPTRQRLIVAMCDALQTHGMNGIGLTELLAAAGAPKGVLYHHFPGGKTELVVAAIDFTVGVMMARLDQLLAGQTDPIGLLQGWMSGAQRLLGDSGFVRGCPLATVALESTTQDLEIRAALACGFVAIRGRICKALVASGHSPTSAQGLAALIIAAYEGGLLQARVEGSMEPMKLVATALAQLLAPYRTGEIQNEKQP